VEAREGPQTLTAVFCTAIPYTIQQSLNRECVAFLMWSNSQWTVNVLLLKGFNPLCHLSNTF